MGFANPAPLALFGFAMPTILFSLMNTQVYSANAALLGLIVCYGGLVQLVVDILEFFKGNTFGLVVFFSYGAFWWSVSWQFTLPHILSDIPPAPGNFMGSFLLLWGIFTFFMWLCTFNKSRISLSVFMTLWLAFIMLSIGDWRNFYGLDNAKNCTIAGGWLGVICSCTAFYLGLSEVVNETVGYVLVPIGDYHKDEAHVLDNWKAHILGGAYQPYVSPKHISEVMAEEMHEHDMEAGQLKQKSCDVSALLRAGFIVRRSGYIEHFVSEELISLT